MYEVAELSLGSGRLGIGPVPGKDGHYKEDLSAALAWHPAMVITMTTEFELEAVGAERLPGDLSLSGVRWRHLPVVDCGEPSAATAAHWPQVSTEARAILARGGAVLVHCYGGCGRAGMAALRIMVEAGEDAEDALCRLRSVRPCAVETGRQFAWATAHAHAFPMGSAAR